MAAKEKITFNQKLLRECIRSLGTVRHERAVTFLVNLANMLITPQEENKKK